FQKFVISSLTKIKYDLSALSHTVNASNMILESGGKLMSSNLPNIIQETLLLEEIFPIKSIGELENLEQKLENDKQFRLNIISKLTLLVGTKSVGDSVRRIMSKMFEDNVLLEYSLQGFKKKKSFQHCKVYRLLIDAIRVHPKFKSLIDKEFDVPLATWLAHAKFRITNKINNKTASLDNSQN
ncbi:DUF4806 domain-containing protein, partial [Aphis craccivora]